MNTERLHPVCEASGRSLQAFMRAANKDATGRAPCPLCGKVVKMRKSATENWPNTIPHHHMPALAASALMESEVRRVMLSLKQQIDAVTERGPLAIPEPHFTPRDWRLISAAIGGGWDKS